MKNSTNIFSGGLRHVDNGVGNSSSISCMIRAMAKRQIPKNINGGGKQYFQWLEIEIFVPQYLFKKILKNMICRGILTEILNGIQWLVTYIHRGNVWSITGDPEPKIIDERVYWRFSRLIKHISLSFTFTRIIISKIVNEHEKFQNKTSRNPRSRALGPLPRIPYSFLHFHFPWNDWFLWHIGSLEI